MIKEVNSINTNPFSKKIEYLEEEKVIGYLEYSLIYDRIEIDNIFVEEDKRNKGIGTELIKKLVIIAQKNNSKNITLEVRESNQIAKKLYNKMGFKEVAIRKYYYGNEDAILMEKVI